MTSLLMEKKESNGGQPITEACPETVLCPESWSMFAKEVCKEVLDPEIKKN